MVMLNVRGTFWCILGIIFVLSIASTALGQQSDSTLTQSQADKIIEKMNELEKNMLKGMHDLELKMRDHVDKKFGELDDKFDELDKRVDRIDLKVNILIGLLTIIGGPILLQILNHAVRNRLNRQNSANTVSRVDSKITSDVATENRDESDEDIRRRYLSDNPPSDPA